MIHLRIVAPADRSARVLDTLDHNESVSNVIHVPGAARSPAGDLILADVAREDTSVVMADLEAFGLERDGSIALADIEAYVSRRSDAAVAHARGAPSDAVVWEEVQARTSEQTELSASFIAFMVIAGLLAAVAIYLDSSVLLVGAMVVGPEFGPIAGFCVAVTTRRPDVARRSFRALAVGFPAAIVAVLGVSLLFRATGVTPQEFDGQDSTLAELIAHPDFLAFFAAASAGAAGVLSLSTAKSGALIGVLVSVTTIPAAANVGISIAYGDGSGVAGSVGQLAVNLSAILLAGTVTLVLQRAFYDRRRARHRAGADRR